MSAFIRIYDSWKQETEQLTHEEKGRLIDSLIEYLETGEEQQPAGNERFVFPLMAERIRRETETHEWKKAAKKSLLMTAYNYFRHTGEVDGNTVRMIEQENQLDLAFIDSIIKQREAGK